MAFVKQRSTFAPQRLYEGWIQRARSVAPNSELGRALGLLAKIVIEGDRTDVTWGEASLVLERAAVEQNRRNPRKATLALTLSDALAFTPPKNIGEDKLGPLLHGYRLLRTAFVAGPEEEKVFDDLLHAGWKVDAPFDSSAWESVRERMGLDG